VDRLSVVEVALIGLVVTVFVVPGVVPVVVGVLGGGVGLATGLVIALFPAAAIGGAVATFATGDLFTIGSLAGLITVVAITIRHAISLVDRYRRLEQVEGGAHGVDLVIEGAQARLAPILITTFGTAAFALPFVLLGDVAGLEVMRPMAIFVLGGLITSTLLLLFILPIIYLRSGPSPASETESLLSEPPAFEPSAA